MNTSEGKLWFSNQQNGAILIKLRERETKYYNLPHIPSRNFHRKSGLHFLITCFRFTDSPFITDQLIQDSSLYPVFREPCAPVRTETMTYSGVGVDVGVKTDCLKKDFGL